MIRKSCKAQNGKGRKYVELVATLGMDRIRQLCGVTHNPNTVHPVNNSAIMIYVSKMMPPTRCVVSLSTIVAIAVDNKETMTRLTLEQSSSRMTIPLCSD